MTAADPPGPASGKGFVELSSWRKIAVSGGDAVVWLDRHCSADVSGLAPGRALKSSITCPGSDAAAEVTVAVVGGTLLLIQDPAEPFSVWDVLLTCEPPEDVDLEDRTDQLALFAFPGRSHPPAAPGTAFSTPSCTGEGVDVFCMAADRARVGSLLEKVYRRDHPEKLST